MTKKLLFLLVSTLLACTAAGAQCNSLPGKTATPGGALHVIYTARLFGYVYLPSHTADEFCNSMTQAKQRYPDAVTIGMGDNLAPEYEARVDNGKAKPRDAVDVRNDNVAVILRDYYDAIVPGKEDFYFGAERLRNIASVTPMNAANLAVGVNFKSEPVDPNVMNRTGYVTKHPKITLYDDGHILPNTGSDGHIRYILRIDPAEAGATAALCPVSKVGCSTPTLAPSPVPLNGTPGLSAFELPAQSPGTRKLFCVSGLVALPPGLNADQWQHDKKRTFCHELVFEGDFLGKQRPYTTVTIGPPNNSDSVIVFGLVDPDIKKEITKNNYSWSNSSGAVTTEVDFLDPEKAFRQAFYVCLLDGACGGGRRIILAAQMSLPKLQNLLMKIAASSKDANSPIVLAFSKPDEPNYSRYGSFAAEGDLNGPVVVVPRGIYEPRRINNPIHLAEVSSGSYTLSANPGDPWSHSLEPNPPAQSEEADLDNTLTRALGSQTTLRTFAVERLRGYYHVDLALMENHDFFSGASLTPSQNLSEKVERVIWDGSHVTRLTLSGKKLKQVLSTKNVPEDHELIISGAIQGDNDIWYVNGLPVADETFYAVVAPTAVVFGDPTYSFLADSSYQPPRPIQDDTVSFRICSEILDLVGGEPCLGSSWTIASSPFGVPAFPAHHNSIFAYLQSVVAPDSHDPFPTLTDQNERDVQHRWINFVQMQKLNAGYSFTKPHPNDKTVGTNFGGVTNSNVVKAHAETYSAEQNMRLGFTKDNYAAGMEETISFGRSRLGDVRPNRTDSVSLTANQATIGPFVEWNIHRAFPPNWKFILRPLDYSSGLARTFLSVSGSSNATFQVNLPASRSVSQKFGVRFGAPQRKDSLYLAEGTSFLEVGAQSRRQIKFPTNILFNPDTTVATPCSLTDAKTPLGKCASTISLVAAKAVPTNFQNERQNGSYWTMLWRFPLGKRVTYKLGSDGEFDFNGRSSAETRYAISVDQYLQTQLFGNLGLTPHFQHFFFENHINRNALQRNTFDVKLSYTFGWHTGLDFWRSVLIDSAAK